jgi:hypothetical protein
VDVRDALRVRKHAYTQRDQAQGVVSVADALIEAYQDRGQIVELVVRAKQELVEHHLEELTETLGEIERLAQ